MLWKYGPPGLAGLVLRKEFIEAAELLRRVSCLDQAWPLSAHELTAAIYYILALKRGERGANPDFEVGEHETKECQVTLVSLRRAHPNTAHRPHRRVPSTEQACVRHRPQGHSQDRALRSTLHLRPLSHRIAAEGSAARMASALHARDGHARGAIVRCIRTGRRKYARRATAATRSPARALACPTRLQDATSPVTRATLAFSPPLANSLCSRASRDAAPLLPA